MTLLWLIPVLALLVLWLTCSLLIIYGTLCMFVRLPGAEFFRETMGE